ncbi:restriction endonuclease subunit S [Bradyrhizobium sp. 160]|uniref:restriction endonuclease subunit S n=1 Tax=Bradyrhizobium sp. 160 TaxID=2782634 RepID=UPI001FF78237|nr:restriction endonuclease subunit S [Bradyrhizobium sp. 160]MCK1625400.1 restriction endonuclease subunit S [Bradyrhizobium sp. 160]
MPFSEAVAINPKRQLPRERQVPFLDMASLPLNGADVSVLTTREMSSGGSRFQSGDTLFARITPSAENGKLGFVQSINGGQVAQGSTEFIVMAGRDGLTLSEYVRYLAGWSEVRDQAIGLMEGTSGRQRVPQSAFDEIEVPIPPLEEQRRIAEVLRSVDEAIERAHLATAGAKAARLALLADLFHRADWEPERALPTGWQTPLLDQVAKRGSGHTPNKQFPTYWDGEVKWISLQDTKRLDRVYIADTTATITPDGLANSSAVLHPASTVVVSRDATVGKSAIMMSDMAVSQHFISYTCGPELSPLYLYYWLQRMKPVFERIGAGSTIKTIGLPFFKTLKIAMPGRAEQDQTAELLWQADRQVFEAEEAVVKLRSVKAVVSSDLLSGRVRVPA